MDPNKAKAIDLAVSQIERQFGKGAIMKLGEGGVQYVTNVRTRQHDNTTTRQRDYRSCVVYFVC